MRIVETELRVRYAETDQMGIVHHANYLTWCELARIEFCRVNGLDYRRLEEEEQILLVVAEANCRYLEPARFDDLILIKSWLDQANPRVLLFAYELYRKNDGKLLTRAWTKHVFCNREMRPVRLSPKYFLSLGIRGKGV